MTAPWMPYIIYIDWSYMQFPRWIFRGMLSSLLHTSLVTIWTSMCFPIPIRKLIQIYIDLKSYYNYDWWWRMQTEVQRRIEEEVEVERQVNQRIEAQGKYMESMLVKACETQEASLTKDYSTLFFAPNTICNNTSPLTIQWFEDQFPSSSSMDSAMHLPDINSNFSLQDSRSSITKNHTVCLG